VAKGSPADVAGLCVGDVLIECAGKVLSTAPEVILFFSAVLIIVYINDFSYHIKCKKLTAVFHIIASCNGS
jgi:hypothetical protein